MKTTLLLIAMLFIARPSIYAYTFQLPGNWNDPTRWDSYPGTNFNGDVYIAANCNMNVTVTMNCCGSLQVNSGRTLTINSGVTYNCNGGMVNMGTVNNSGSVVLGGFLSYLENTGQFNNTGSFNNQYLTIYNRSSGIFRNTGTYINGSNGSINNEGSFVNTGIYKGTGNFQGNFTNSSGGRVAPGNSPGNMRFSFGYTNNTGSMLDIELGGTDIGVTYDNIDVFATATMGGTLRVTLVNGFVPVPGQSFVLVNASTLIGSFSTLSLPVVAGVSWSVSYTGTSVILNANSTVPVSLPDFTGLQTDIGVTLLWRTAWEQNNRGFTVQNSSDGTNWRTAGFVAGKGNTSTGHSYNFDVPAAGITGPYWRLEQSDLNGDAEYSKIIYIGRTPPKQTFEIFPNPVSGNTLFIVPGNISGMAVIELLNTAGQKIYQWEAAAFHQGQTVSLRLPGMAKGIYFLKILQNDRAVYIGCIITE
jgi:Secretion system C-terminal sorting domain